jgi:hypothetical protein
LLGPQLAALLLPESDMPAGYTLIASAAKASGTATPDDTSAPVPAGNELCKIFASSYFLPAAGFITSTYAQNGYSNPGDTAEVDQSIDVLTGNDARTAMQRLWAAFGKCASFSYQYNGTTVNCTLKRSTLSGIGDEAVAAVNLCPIVVGGVTLVAVRVGDMIITVADSSAGNDHGSAAIGYARQLAAKLQAVIAG